MDIISIDPITLTRFCITFDDLTVDVYDTDELDELAAGGSQEIKDMIWDAAYRASTLH